MSSLPQIPSSSEITIPSSPGSRERAASLKSAAASGTGYFCCFRKSTIAFASACDTEPGLIAALITPFM